MLFLPSHGLCRFCGSIVQRLLWLFCLVENLIECLMNIFCYAGILWYTGPGASYCHHGDQFIIVRDCLLQFCRIRTLSYWYLCWHMAVFYVQRCHYFRV